MNTRTWPYGTTLKCVVHINQLSKAFRRDGSKHEFRTLIVVDDQNEAHVLLGQQSDAKEGDHGTITFTAGGPTGGYWQFTKSEIP